MFVGLFDQFKSPIRFLIGYKPAILLNQPEDIQRVLQSHKCCEKILVYNFFPFQKSLLFLPRKYLSTRNIIFIFNLLKNL